MFCGDGIPEGGDGGVDFDLKIGVGKISSEESLEKGKIFDATGRYSVGCIDVGGQLLVSCCETGC